MKKMMKASSALLFLIAIVMAEPLLASEFRGILRNNEGVRNFNEKRYNQAFEKFGQSLGDLAFEPQVHYNLGRVYFENKDYEKAYRESLNAAKLATKNRDLQFLALFQAAAALGEMKKVDEAIMTYQQALEINPGSVEVKTNIELLVQQGQGGGGDQSQQQAQGNGNSDDQQNQGQQPNNPSQPMVNRRDQPRSFQGKDLTNKDVENILDELEAQEESIRAKFQREGSKDLPRDKDW